MMETSMDYPEIDMEKTGLLLRCLVASKGYMVKDIQRMLGLGSPQPIYRWLQGKYLPSVDNLYRLSMILGVHMEELLANQGTDLTEILAEACASPDHKRLLSYCRKVRESAA